MATLDLEIHISTSMNRAALVARLREITELIESGRTQGEYEYNQDAPMSYRFRLDKED